MDFSELDTDQTLIITASRRQARYLREQYAGFQLEAGKDVWQSLKTMPWQAFVNYCWELALDNGQQLPTRLSQPQSQYLWQQMVSSSEVTQSLLNSRQTQKLSQDAWRVCQQWQINQLEHLPGDEDHSAFDTWFRHYEQQLAEEGWSDSYQQANVLLECLSSFLEYLPSNIITYGFQQQTPQQAALIKALSSVKSVTHWQLQQNQKSDNAGTVKLYALAEPEQELLAAVRWAKQKLIDNPSQQLAIVVPELEKWRNYIERLIQREFYLESFIAGKDNKKTLHDFSIDESLVQQPLVALILDYLTLTHSGLSKAQLQHLLLSPYLYSSKEEHWRATHLELSIKKSNKAFYSVDDLLKITRRQQLSLSWLDFVHQWQNNKKGDEAKKTGKADYQFQVNQVIEILSEVHWSGYNALSSREYQVQQTLLDAIKSSLTLQKVTSKELSYARSVKLVKQFIEQQTFHQQQPKAPLQIMGILEAIGLTFDATWLVGATDQVLPQKATPNPFLSKTLHLKHGLPGSSHSRELEYAQSVLESLLCNSELIISYAEYDGEQEQMMSPLLQPVAQKFSIEHYDVGSLIAESIKEWPLNHGLESYQDNQGQPLTEHYDVKGGTGLLRMQAASPFDAYLRYRLGLEVIEKDSLGVSFMDRGNLFHKAMQLIWSKLRTQQSLMSLSGESEDDLINKTLSFVLSEAARHIYLLNNPQFFQVELSRLRVLIQESLELDRQREPFTVIGTEEPRTIELAGLKFSLIIDRIDQIDDGRLLIIDYKTGQPKLMSLFKDPIAEPQLLLYALSEQSSEQSVAGILFMQAHLKACKYIGITDEANMLDGVKALKELAYNPYADSFDESVHQWRDILSQLAQDFKGGKAGLTDYSGDYSDHLAVSRWAQRDTDFNMIIEGASND